MIAPIPEPWFADTLTWLNDLAHAVGDEVVAGAARLRSDSADKAGVDLVTAADHLAEARFVDAIAQRFPEHRIAAEEGSHRGPADSPWCWWIDPLDGTCNFSRGQAYWAHSLGLAYDDQPVLGLIHAPDLALTVSGGRGCGAWCNGEPLPPTTPVGAPKTWVVATDWPWDAAQRGCTGHLLAGLAPLIRQYKTFGSAALDKAQLARGLLDAYAIAGTFPWDQCAGVAILRELGFEVHRWSAEPWRIGCGDIAICRPGMWSMLGPICASAPLT